jgi:hypothetical protein
MQKFCKCFFKVVTITGLVMLSSCIDDPITPITQYTITASAGPNGTITPTGAVAVVSGGTTTFTMTPSAGYKLSSLLVDGVAVNPPTATYTFTAVTANHTISAAFAVIAVTDSLTITSSAGTNGTITPLGAVKVPYGGTATFTITPNAGFATCSLLVDNTPVTPIQSTYSFTNVIAGRTIRAAFAPSTGFDTIKSTNINTIATALTGKQYIVVGSLTLTGTLTIQPGAILKFTPGSSITIANGASLTATGTAAAPIYFTSIKDDAHGTDANGDGATTTPAKSDWGYINIKSNNVSLQYCQFWYGGASTNYVVNIDGVVTTISNCSFVYNNGGALGGPGALDASDAGLTSEIKSNMFYGNTVPISISPNFSLDTSNTYTNLAVPLIKNTYQCITIHGNTITTAATWAETELPFYIKSWLSISTAASALNIQPGVVVKFDAGANLTVEQEGTLNSVGSAEKPIHFTSIKNDAIGGDANGDTTQSTPSATGDWQNVTVKGTKSTIKYCVFSYGGKTSGDVLNLTGGSSIQLENCTFAYNFGGTLKGDGALNAQATAQTTKILNNRFYGNSLPISIPIYMTFDTSNSFSSIDGTIKNTYNCISIGQNTISVQTSWTETEVPFYLSSWMSVANNGVLTLAPGVVIKLDAGNSIGIEDDGTLNAVGTAEKPIHFTSIKNDAVGGDVNGDGTSSTPSPNGDWSNITFKGNGSMFKYCVVTYGGATSLYAVSVHAVALSVENCLFAYNNGGTFFGKGALNMIDAAATSVVKNNTFYGNTLPLSIDGNMSLDTSNIFSNPANPTEKNTYNCITVQGGRIISAASWAETEVAFVPKGWLEIATNASLTLGANVALKFSPTAKSLIIENGGTFNDTQAGIVLTSYKDDTVKGDSNGDGTATSPVEGDWDGVYNSPTSSYIEKAFYSYDDKQ